MVILIPAFNDWEAAALLLGGLNAALPGVNPDVVFIDDGSTETLPDGFASGSYPALGTVSVLQLRRNLGHQRAIAVGLVYVYQNMACDAVTVMDCDGEDRPEDIPALVAKFERTGRRAIIFAARSKRLERVSFRVLYQVYRAIHLVLTGDHVRVGNFSVVPFQSLAKLVVIPEIWNHYAAAVIRSRLAFETIPIARGRRLAGESRMNFIGLLLHGLSAFFVYGDIVGARLLVGIALALILEVAILGAGLAYTFASLAAILGIVLLQAIPVALILVFTVIGSRANFGFLPIRDCPYFVNCLRRVYPKLDEAHEDVQFQSRGGAG